MNICQSRHLLFLPPSSGSVSPQGSAVPACCLSGTSAGLAFRDPCVPISCRLCVLCHPIFPASHPYPPELSGSPARAARISWALRIIGFSPCLSSKESDQLLPSPAPRSGFQGSHPPRPPLLLLQGGRALSTSFLLPDSPSHCRHPC